MIQNVSDSFPGLCGSVLWSRCAKKENSNLLVVSCSPRAVQSRFVADEIRHFKEIGKGSRILALMSDGEPNAEDPAPVLEEIRKTIEVR